MEPTKLSLPENAYRKLNDGESYRPVVPAEVALPETTAYSLISGLIYAAVFSFAAAFLGLKIGQVFEAAIPIAILAAGYTAFTKRKNSLLENVLVQSIGAASGVIVAGAIFTRIDDPRWPNNMLDVLYLPNAGGGCQIVAMCDDVPEDLSSAVGREMFNHATYWWFLYHLGQFEDLSGGAHSFCPPGTCLKNEYFQNPKLAVYAKHKRHWFYGDADGAPDGPRTL